MAQQAYLKIIRTFIKKIILKTITILMVIS